MSPEELIYFAAIMLIGVPAAFRLDGIRNPTALAMVATWFVGRAVYVLSGDGMPIKAMVLFDWAVIVTIFAKKDWRICAPHSGLEYLACFVWHERSPCDRAIIAMFPVVWLFYAPVAGPITQFWVLYLLGLAQLMLAGFEALQHWLGAMAKQSRADAKGRSPPGLNFHAPVRETGFG